ncbi:MAG: hypothetical protein ACYTF1_18085 [Planctomycetota bacterium]
MNRIALTFLILILLAPSAAFAAAATSASFGLTLIVADAGGEAATSASYGLIGKLRDYAPNYPNVPISVSFRLNEGFLRSIFYGPILGTFITVISPDEGYNDGSVFMTIKGGNLRQTGITTVELQLTGETTIVATSVSVPSTSNINCVFDISGATPGFWTVYVNNDGFEATLGGAFRVWPAPLQIIGPALNFPNPFDPDDGPTAIRYTLTQDATITLNLYNIRGEKILTRKFPAGTAGGSLGANEVFWDGKSVFGAVVPNGVYVVQLVGGGKTLAIMKIAIVR